MDSQRRSAIIHGGFGRREIHFEMLSSIAVDVGGDRERNVKKALQLIDERRLRSSLFEGIEFGEPAWAILLDLYVSAARGLHVSVSSLCIASGVPASTALRCISHLEKTGRLVRIADKKDRRRAFISLATDTHREMDSYLSLICERDRLKSQ